MTPEEIKKLREALHLTQEDLAEKVGVRATTISRWERGDRKPRGPAIKQLLAVKALQGK